MAVSKEKLMQLLERIERTEKKQEQLKGQEEMLLQTMKADYQCETVAELQVLIEKTDKEAEVLEQEIKEMNESLQESYPQLFI